MLTWLSLSPSVGKQTYPDVCPSLGDCQHHHCHTSVSNPDEEEPSIEANNGDPYVRSPKNFLQDLVSSWVHNEPQETLV